MSRSVPDEVELTVMGADLVAMLFATFYSGKAAAKFAKICGFR